LTQVDQVCPRCARPVSDSAKFCTSCGARLDAGTEEMKRCPKCNLVMLAQAKFCTGCGASLRVEEDPNLEQVIKGTYRLKRLLGKGATGRVYLAEQLSLKKQVAVKLLDPFYAEDATAKARFEREALAASRLTHPNSIIVHDFGETSNGALFLAMEYAKGKSLAEVIAQTGGLQAVRTCEIMMQICSALVEAHDQGVIHRDLKPENIVLVLQRDGRELVKVLDFGIAQIVTGEEANRKITRFGLVCGTPEYMSPEQARSKKLDARTDVYSLGVMLYEALTGTIPFEDISALKVAQMHIHDPPEPFADRRPDLRIPDAVERVCFKALEKKRSQRYQSALEFQQALEDARRHIELNDEATEIVTPPTREPQRERPEVPKRPSRVIPAGQGAGFTPAPFGFTPPDRKYFDSVGLDMAGRLDGEESVARRPEPAADQPLAPAAPFAPGPTGPLPGAAAKGTDPARALAKGGSSIELDFERASMDAANIGHPPIATAEPEYSTSPAAPSAPFVWPRWAAWIAVVVVVGVAAILVIELGETSVEDSVGRGRATKDHARFTAERLHGEGLGMLRRKNYEGAVERFKTALRTDPTFFTTHRDLGTAYASLKRPRQGLRQYRLYLKKMPDAEDADRVRAMIRRIRETLKGKHRSKGKGSSSPRR